MRQFANAREVVDAICTRLEAVRAMDTVEVIKTYHGRALVQSQKMAVCDLRQTLLKLCREFPGAVVRYKEDDPNAQILSIWCQCENDVCEGCPERDRCKRAPDSPRVTVILDEHEGQQVLIGRKLAPA